MTEGSGRPCFAQALTASCYQPPRDILLRSQKRWRRKMKRRVAAVMTVGFALAAAGCNSPDTREADVKALKDLEAQWAKDIATKDPEKWAAYYTDDASFLPQGSPTVTGKEALRGLIKSLVSDPNFALTF